MNDIGYIFCFPHLSPISETSVSTIESIWDIQGYLGIFTFKKKHIKPIPAARRLTDLRTYHLRKKKNKHIKQSMGLRWFSIFTQTRLFLPSCCSENCYPNRLETLVTSVTKHSIQSHGYSLQWDFSSVPPISFGGYKHVLEEPCRQNPLPQKRQLYTFCFGQSGLNVGCPKSSSSSLS